MAEGQRMTAADVVAQVRDGRLEDFVKEAVVLVCRTYLRRQRGTTETARLEDLLQYHQRRNTTASQSRQKRPRKLRRFAAL